MKKAIALFLTLIAVSACTVSCETVGKGVTDAKVSYAYQN